MRMKYFHTMVRISNIEESLDFYCTKLGLREVRRVDNEAGRFTNLFLAAPSDQKPDTEEDSARLRDYHATLELTYNWPSEDGTPAEQYGSGRNFGHLAYQVENIYETCAQLQTAGVTINRPPRDGRMAFIQSPDGISIELLQASGSLEPAEPWVSMENTGTW